MFTPEVRQLSPPIHVARQGRERSTAPAASCSRPTRASRPASRRTSRSWAGGWRMFEVWDRGAVRRVRARRRATAADAVREAVGASESSGSRSRPRGRGRVSPAAARRGLGDRRDGGDGRARGGAAGARAAPDVRLLGLDADPEAVAQAGARLARFGDRARAARTPASPISATAAAGARRHRGARRAARPRGVVVAARGVGARLLLPGRRAARHAPRPHPRRDGGRAAEPAAGGRAGPHPATSTARSRTRGASRARIVRRRPLRTTGDLVAAVRAAVPRAAWPRRLTSPPAPSRPCAWPSTTSRAPSGRRSRRRRAARPPAGGSA